MHNSILLDGYRRPRATRMRNLFHLTLALVIGFMLGCIISKLFFEWQRRPLPFPPESLERRVSVVV